MSEDFFGVQEYLQSIRQRRSQLLERLRETGELHEYTRRLHAEMIEKYPDMIEKIYTKEEIDQGGMNQ